MTVEYKGIRGIPLGHGVFATVINIPGKGKVHYDDLTNEEIREAINKFSIHK